MKYEFYSFTSFLHKMGSAKQTGKQKNRRGPANAIEKQATVD